MSGGAIRGVLLDSGNTLVGTRGVILAELGVQPTAELLAELSAPLDVPVFEAFPEARWVLAVVERPE